MARTLIFLGLGGYLWWAVEAVWYSFPFQSTDGWSFGAAAILLMVVPVAAWLFLREGTRAVTREPLLWIPRGVLALLTSVVSTAMVWDLFYRTVELDIVGVSLGLSIYFVVLLALHVLYAAWVTRALLDRERNERFDLAGSFQRFWSDVPRTALFMLVGQVGTILLMGLALLAGDVAMVILPLLSVAWNLLTYALLPAGLEASSIGAGFRASLRAARRGRIWGLLILQVLVYGHVMFLSVSGESVTVEGSTRTVSSFHTTGWYMHAEWLGGYEENFQWHDKLMASVIEGRSWPLAGLWLSVLGALFAIAIKVEVIRVLRLSWNE